MHAISKKVEKIKTQLTTAKFDYLSQESDLESPEHPQKQVGLELQASQQKGFLELWNERTRAEKQDPSRESTQRPSQASDCACEATIASSSTPCSSPFT